MRTRAIVARAWEISNDVPAVFGGAGKGAQRAAWAASFAAETSALSGGRQLASLLDLVKAFERIPHHLVADAAARLGFNLVVLRLSLASYRLARAIGVDGTFSVLLIATRGITAGSGFATLELRILLHEAIVISTRRWPLLQLYVYVDDLTIAAAGTSELCLSTARQATDFFVRVFEQGFKLEVSCAKSFAVSARISHALALARATTKRVLQPVRATKLLGVAYAGGTRRSVKTLNGRLKQFRSKLPRIHALRKQGVSASKVVKAMGAPGMLYGVDVSGLSNTHLHNVRVAALRASLPPGAGRNADVAYAVLDAGGRSLDPAFAAHATPVKHWGMAIWQKWVALPELTAAFDQAHAKLSEVRAHGQKVWAAVTGPAAALIATVWRLGWTCDSAHIFRDDTGAHFDLLRMSPALVVKAVHRSVERWRFKRVCAVLPDLVPSATDLHRRAAAHMDETASEVFTFLVDRPLGPLVRGTSRITSTVPQWSTKCRSQLLSAATGGQWPQVRVAKIPHATTDNRCQLCFSQTGTLQHRRNCPVTRPAEGWPPPPLPCSTLVSGLGARRHDLLLTRGLLALSIPRPPQQEEVALKWISDPPYVSRSDLRWYTDGSQKYGNLWELKRTGCAVVVVSTAGDLVAFGHAIPPAWVRTAAAAELWAVMIVLMANLAPPVIVTDCLSILEAAKIGTTKTTSPSRMLAQIWAQIAVTLDADVCSLIASGHLLWMPAHGPVSAIGRAVRSDGCTVTAVDWPTALPMRSPSWQQVGMCEARWRMLCSLRLKSWCATRLPFWEQ